MFAGSDDGGASAASQQGSAGGASASGAGLRAGSVPAQYAGLVVQAGSICAAATAPVIAAQIEQESAWNPDAVSGDIAGVQRGGAEGISQFMPATWAEVAGPGQSPFDPTAAIPAQGRYDCMIAAQLAAAQHAGQVSASVPLTSLMLAGYNAGPDRVLASGGIPQNRETPPYVAQITARAASYFAAPEPVAAAVRPAGGQLAGESNSFGQAVVAAAQAAIGTPYSWGGGDADGPTRGIGTGAGTVGFDCSGLVMFAIAQASAGKIVLPHSSDAQTRPSSGGVAVARDPASMLPGDIISFTQPGSSSAHHVGIYLGGMKMIDAPQTGDNVRLDDLTRGYYQQQAWRIARFR